MNLDVAGVVISYPAEVDVVTCPIEEAATDAVPLIGRVRRRHYTLATDPNENVFYALRRMKQRFESRNPWLGIQLAYVDLTADRELSLLAGGLIATCPRHVVLTATCPREWGRQLLATDEPSDYEIQSWCAERGIREWSAAACRALAVAVACARANLADLPGSRV